MNSSAKTPDFMVIGSMKCGTTSLYNDLYQHEDIFLSSVKEPWVLATPADKNEYLNRYSKIYERCRDNQLAGEFGTAYTFDPLFKGIPERAYNTCGASLKLICCLRDPVERSLSHLRHDIAVGRINIENANSAAVEDRRYVDVSNYAYQLSQWNRYFDLDNLHLVSFSKYTTERSNTVNKIFDFLKLPRESVDASLVYNKTTDVKKTPSYIRNIISTTAYRNYIKERIPHSIKMRLKSLFIRGRATSRVFTPTNEIMQYLQSELADVKGETELLIGKPVEW